MNWARPGGTVAWVGFKPTALGASQTGTGEQLCAVFPPDRQALGRPTDDVRDREHFLALSSDYKKENAGRSYLLVAIFPIVEVSYHRPLAAG
jgi:hypothetical protein